MVEERAVQSVDPEIVPYIQTLPMQLSAMRAYAMRRGWKVAGL
jgi:hypothetical protein